jgi:hypothetical protein
MTNCVECCSIHALDHMLPSHCIRVEYLQQLNEIRSQSERVEAVYIYEGAVGQIVEIRDDSLLFRRCKGLLLSCKLCTDCHDCVSVECGSRVGAVEDDPTVPGEVVYVCSTNTSHRMRTALLPGDVPIHMGVTLQLKIFAPEGQHLPFQGMMRAFAPQHVIQEMIGKTKAAFCNETVEDQVAAWQSLWSKEYRFNLEVDARMEKRFVNIERAIHIDRQMG